MRNAAGITRKLVFNTGKAAAALWMKIAAPPLIVYHVSALKMDTFNDGMLSESGVRWMICKYAEMLLSPQLRQHCAELKWDAVAFTYVYLDKGCVRALY